MCDLKAAETFKYYKEEEERRNRNLKVLINEYAQVGKFHKKLEEVVYEKIDEIAEQREILAKRKQEIADILMKVEVELYDVIKKERKAEEGMKYVMEDLRIERYKAK